LYKVALTALYLIVCLSFVIVLKHVAYGRAPFERLALGLNENVGFVYVWIISIFTGMFDEVGLL